MKGIFISALEFDVGERHEIDHSYPYLGQHGVFGGSHEGFDFEVLLDPFEESFDLPSCLVDCGYGRCCEAEIVGQEDQVFFSVGVVEFDQAKLIRVIFWVLCTQLWVVFSWNAPLILRKK